MNTLRRISAATILSLTLIVPVFAGHIETPGAPAPKSTSTSTTTTTTTTDEITTEILLATVSVIYG